MMVGRRRLWTLLALGCAAGLALLFVVRDLAESSNPPGQPSTYPAPISTKDFFESFGSEPLDSTRWVFTSEGDFEERLIDVREGRLRLRAATRGTRHDIVKYLDRKSVPQFKLGKQTRFSADLD